MPIKPMTRADLDQITVHGGCDPRENGSLSFYCYEHLRANLEVSYERYRGLLRVGCQQCGQTIALIQPHEGERQ